MDKEYKTRDGRSARVLCVDRDSELYPVIALVEGRDALIYTKEGKFHSGAHVAALDLIEVKPRIKLTKYMNVYTAGITVSFDSRVAADRHNLDRIACVKLEIDCEVGEGLDDPAGFDDDIPF